MYSKEQIKQIVTPIAEQFDLERVELFGSYASGLADEKSDLDFLVTFKIEVPSLFDVCYLFEKLKEALNTDIHMITLPIPPQSELVILHKVIVYEG